MNGGTFDSGTKGRSEREGTVGGWSSCHSPSEITGVVFKTPCLTWGEKGEEHNHKWFPGIMRLFLPQQPFTEMPVQEMQLRQTWALN